MKTMTVAEIKNMVGTEFRYVMGDRGEFDAVVAAFDEKVGMTCLATCLVDSLGNDYSDEVDENGNLCLVGLDAERHGDNFLPKVSWRLPSIKNLGYYKADSAGGFGYHNNGGNASCSFS